MNADLLQSGEIMLRLLAAVTAGAIVGINRWLSHKPAGFGTHGLVALGAAVATLLVIRAPGSDAQSVSRVIQGLVTGVGFIGAGVIMRSEANREVHGLTTAASIWATAIIGIACGVADFVVCSLGVLLALLILIVSKPLENLVGRLLGRRPESNQI